MPSRIYLEHPVGLASGTHGCRGMQHHSAGLRAVLGAAGLAAAARSTILPDCVLLSDQQAWQQQQHAAPFYRLTCCYRSRRPGSSGMQHHSLCSSDYLLRAAAAARQGQEWAVAMTGPFLWSGCLPLHVWRVFTALATVPAPSVATIVGNTHGGCLQRLPLCLLPLLSLLWATLVAGVYRARHCACSFCCHYCEQHSWRVFTGLATVPALSVATIVGNTRGGCLQR